jgi:hypothetical protein
VSFRQTTAVRKPLFFNPESSLSGRFSYKEKIVGEGRKEGTEPSERGERQIRQEKEARSSERNLQIEPAGNKKRSVRESEAQGSRNVR